MTYLSHAVRSLRRDPVPGETVRLVVTLGEDATAEAVREAVESLGGGVVRELEFDRLLVAVEQTEVGAVCELDGLAAVETDAVTDQT